MSCDAFHRLRVYVFLINDKIPKWVEIYDYTKITKQAEQKWTESTVLRMD